MVFANAFVWRSGAQNRELVDTMMIEVEKTYRALLHSIAWKI